MFNRRTTFLTAIFETAIALVISVAVLLFPITLVWLIENSAEVDWSVAYKTAADIWLKANGVPIVVPSGVLEQVEFKAFAITLLPLSLTALVLSAAFRLGRKLAGTSSLWPGWLGSIGLYFVISLLITSTAHSDVAYVIDLQGAFIPPLLFGAVLVATSLFAKPEDLGVVRGYLEARERVVVRTWLTQKFEELPWVIRVVAKPALRAGTAVVFALLAVAAIAFSLALAFNWISAIRLYESMQLSYLGIGMVTLAQLAVLPNLIIMTAAWFTGAGFSIGTGSWVSPLATQLGPIPNLPVFAVIPTEQMTFGLFAIAVPLASAFLATIAVKNYAAELRFEFATAFNAALTLGIAIGVVAAIEMLFLQLIAGGSVGPARLQTFGANPFITALVLLVEVAAAATAAAFFTARPEQPDAEVLQRQFR